MNIKPYMGQISGTWRLLLCEYWRKSMIIGEKNTDLKRLTGRLKLRFLTEIGRFHWNQGEEVAHFAWFGEPGKTNDLLKEVQFIWNFLWPDNKKVTAYAGLSVNVFFVVGNKMTSINVVKYCKFFHCSWTHDYKNCNSSEK